MRLASCLLGIGLAAGAVAAVAQQAQPVPDAGDAVEVELAVDLGHLSLRQVEIIRLLVRAARVMDALYQQQIAEGGFYPPDLDWQELDAWDHAASRNPYTRIERGPGGELEAVPYHEAWPRELGYAARLLARAGELTGDEALRTYLTLQARAFITGDYARAHAAWRALRGSDLDFVIGPLGTGADREFGLKAAFGAYVLLRDWDWGARLARFTVFLPELQHSLPVSAAFKAEVPEVDVKLSVYDLLYQAGYGTAGSGGLEASVGLRAGQQQSPRRLQLRNVMQARFDAVVLPLAGALIVPEQARHVRFEAWFLNAMLQEMGHSLGLRRTIDDRGTVRLALREHADTIEEAKAAVLALWMSDWLRARGELAETTRLEHYASFLAHIFFGSHLDAYDAGGQARVLLFNYFRDFGAFRRDPASGLYRVDETGMMQAVEMLAAQLLTLQGSGDHEGAAALIEAMAEARPEFRGALEQLRAAGVPAALVIVQGEELLGL
jgi:hypothetical protein